eukprot:COSAG06_NODE_36_length_30622_cov_18.404869_16_plen_253_part_00
MCESKRPQRVEYSTQLPGQLYLTFAPKHGKGWFPDVRCWYELIGAPPSILLCSIADFVVPLDTLKVLLSSRFCIATGRCGCICKAIRAVHSAMVLVVLCLAVVWDEKVHRRWRSCRRQQHLIVTSALWWLPCRLAAWNAATRNVSSFIPVGTADTLKIWVAVIVRLTSDCHLCGGASGPSLIALGRKYVFRSALMGIIRRPAYFVSFLQAVPVGTDGVLGLRYCAANHLCDTIQATSQRMYRQQVTKTKPLW